MNEEEIIKKRLLVDGDGAGDDRRINLLLKQFQQWCADDEADVKLTRDHLLSQVNKCEYAFLKSRLTATMAEAEVENYEFISKQIEQEIERVKEEIVKTKEDFKEAKVIRKNRLEYEVLAKVINEQQDRKETNEKLEKLRSELETLEVKYNQLESKLDMRRKQFHVLFASLHQLQVLLDEDDNDENNLIDVSLETLDELDTKREITDEVMDIVM
ncbi:THO complex subunit 7 homolog [Cimex lectularius]|uniref:THO complex subunit 7 n=1 Tax=Cimex lectularius TaxID=79782 RepID=A0A8I6TJ46_CIMLE|nr:THO complex subunit 7 homolog [Cimex lectularius]